MKKLLALFALAATFGFCAVAFAQGIVIPTEPLTGDAASIKAVFDAVVATVGTGGAGGVVGIVVALLGLVAKLGVSILRTGAIQRRLPAKLQWVNLGIVFQAAIVFVFAAAASFAGAVLVVGAKAAAIAALGAALPVALAAMGVNRLANAGKPAENP